MQPSPAKLSLTEILRRTPAGQSFFTEVKDTVVGSYAHRAGIKVQTERMLAIRPAKRELIELTRVTVVSVIATESPPKVNAAKPANSLGPGRRRRQPIVES